MTISEIESIVAQHMQKYTNSCSPSLAEMLLKIRGAVGPNYYAEQDRDKDENVGITKISNMTVAGQTFRHLQGIPSTKSFTERINDLLTGGHPVGIYLPTSFGFHGFVISVSVR